jgi:hypothetical protein
MLCSSNAYVCFQHSSRSSTIGISSWSSSSLCVLRQICYSQPGDYHTNFDASSIIVSLLFSVMCNEQPDLPLLISTLSYLPFPSCAPSCSPAVATQHCEASRLLRQAKKEAKSPLRKHFDQDDPSGYLAFANARSFVPRPSKANKQALTPEAAEAASNNLFNGAAAACACTHVQLQSGWDGLDSCM